MTASRNGEAALLTWTSLFIPVESWEQEGLEWLQHSILHSFYEHRSMSLSFIMICSGSGQLEKESIDRTPLTLTLTLASQTPETLLRTYEETGNLLHQTSRLWAGKRRVLVLLH